MMLSYGRESSVCRPWNAFWALAMILFCTSICSAESPASKNRQGNRMFAEGRYEEAEGAYLGAEALDPGRPEILYNLGNALIKQNRHKEGIQALQPSIGDGNARTKQHSWYNTGNALYAMGNFKDSSEAYIQALRLNPADRDAKHNLELALRELEKQKRSRSSRDPENSEEPAPTHSTADNREGEKRQDQRDQSHSDRGKERNDTESSQSRNAAERKGTLGKEQALQILDAVQNQELTEHRKLLEPRAIKTPSDKDW